MLPRLSVWLVGLACVFPSALFANPANKKTLETWLGPFMKRAVDCRFCHLPDAPGTKPSLDEVDKPHNVFGQRLVKIRKELAKAGKPNDLESRLNAIAQEDSDGDGISNIHELLTGYFPGDDQSKPASTDLTNLETTLKDFEKYQARYRWKPYEPVVRPTVPVISPGETVRQPLDAFIIHERQQQRLLPRPEASKEVLLRRLYLDLTGLPPTTEERTAFLSDNNADSYERLVDRLLASPRYAERWARHWMDIWRYSDWAGYGNEIRESQPHIWRWRDWIVDSLHEDKSYDQMVREMLAGDEIAPEDDKTIRATGFLVRNWFKFNRNVWLDNTVEHTAKAFLGTTMNCARCHDHMYDPIKQTDYYSFRAFFEPLQIRIDRVPGQADTNKDGLARIYDANLDAVTYLFTRGNEALADKEKPCPPQVPASIKGPSLGIEAIKLPRDAHDVEQRLHVLEEVVQQARKQGEQEKQQRLEKHWSAISSVVMHTGPISWLGLPLTITHLTDAQAGDAAWVASQSALALAELRLALRKQTQPEPASLLLAESLTRQTAMLAARQQLLKTQATYWRTPAKKQGEVKQAIQQAENKFQQAQSTLLKPLTGQQAAAKYPASSSGRRLALAKWITDVRNPLAARVAVNHVWMRHFGQPLVGSVFDFGKNGQPPTHPALLDWLAAEFMDSGWSLKKLHKLIVTSNTYRLDSTPASEAVARDPDNKYYWRRLPQRMQAEAVRDSLLHLAGKLDLKQGGPELDHEAGLSTYRRSLYYRHANEKQMTFLVSFDAPTPAECYRRDSSVVPQQALALANSSLAQEASAAIASRLMAQLGPQANPSSFIDRAFELLIGRHATDEEQKLCQSFLTEQEKRSQATVSATVAQKAQSSLVLVLLNHHEFVTVR